MKREQNVSTVLQFLQQSNAIEDVWDADSLLQAWYAWEYGQDCEKFPELSTNLVLKTHKILMLHQRLSPHHRGYWRDCAVMIGGKLAPHYAEVSELMQHWVNLFKHATTEEDIKQAHIEFEHIHPFVDGNGRVGRLILNWQRVRAGLPILIINEQTKSTQYYSWFKL